MLVTLRAGQSVDNPFREPNTLVQQAEQRGYLVVTPMGYRLLRQPYYGSKYPIARPKPSVPAEGWTPQEDERAEQDVLNVIDLVTKDTEWTPHASTFTARTRPGLERFTWAPNTRSGSRRW